MHVCILIPFKTTAKGKLEMQTLARCECTDGRDANSLSAILDAKMLKRKRARSRGDAVVCDRASPMEAVLAGMLPTPEAERLD
eukprot:6340757-Prymnesium_polylepis.1